MFTYIDSDYISICVYIFWLVCLYIWLLYVGNWTCSFVPLPFHQNKMQYYFILCLVRLFDICYMLTKIACTCYKILFTRSLIQCDSTATNHELSCFYVECSHCIKSKVLKKRVYMCIFVDIHQDYVCVCIYIYRKPAA